MTNASRMKDLSDVLELIKILNLPANFADQLNPFVREKYLELWNQGKKRYRDFLLAEQVAHFRGEDHRRYGRKRLPRATAEELEEMRKAGVTLADDGGVGDDYVTLVTTDPEVAKRFGMEEEREYLDEEDEN